MLEYEEVVTYHEVTDGPSTYVVESRQLKQIAYQTARVTWTREQFYDARIDPRITILQVISERPDAITCEVFDLDSNGQRIRAPHLDQLIEGGANLPHTLPGIVTPISHSQYEKFLNDSRAAIEKSLDEAKAE